MNHLIPSAVTLAQRIITIRSAYFGEGQTGIIAVSARLGLPVQTWMNFEAGVNMPASIMIHFLVVTHANPTWLLRGSGDMFSTSFLADQNL